MKRKTVKIIRVSTWRCINCGTYNGDHSDVCSNCGKGK